MVTVVTKGTNVHQLLWLRESARRESLCENVLAVTNYST